MKNEIEKYLEYIKLKNFSISTITVRRQSLMDFKRWLEKQGKTDIREVTTEDLKNYLSSMQEKGFTNNTVDTRIRSVKLLCEYLEKQQIILINPAERLEMPSLGRRLPLNILTEEEVKRLLIIPNLETSAGIRDRAIMELLYSSAIRRSECTALNVYDIDIEGGYLRINQGKGRKDRIVPLGKKACEYLKLYLKKVRPQLVNDPDINFLFLHQGKQLQGESINRIIQRNARKGGLSIPVTVHSFRKAAVTHMLRAGASPMYLQKMLGHSTGETMKKYLKVSIKDIKEMHNKKHPGEKSR